MAFGIVFYAMLAALVVIQIRSQETAKPNHTNANPVLSFFPMNNNKAERTLIIIKNNDDYRNWSDNLSDSLDKYYKLDKIASSNITMCSYTDEAENGHVCHVDYRDWKECNREQFFNYYRASPCIFLKLNQTNKWIPEVYNDPDDLPANMPESLKDNIRKITPRERRNNIWVTCEGENAADVENLGPVAYHPQIQGFPGFYFPVRNNDDYLSPLVAVRFLRPQRGVFISIECKAWAKNIKHNRKDRLGSVHLDLFIF